MYKELIRKGILSMKMAIPFILRFIESKEGVKTAPGYYSDTDDIWVVEGICTMMPLIKCNTVDVRELKTMTRAGGERED